MSRRDIPDWVQTVVTLAVLITVCWLLLRMGLENTVPGDTGSASSSPASAGADPAKDRKPASCSSSVVRCVAESETTIEGIAHEPCNVPKARQKLESDLHSPLDSPGCRDAMTKLALGCPPGCTLDPTPPLVVPGALDVRVDDFPNESGMCRASGTITVVLKGTCSSK